MRGCIITWIWLSDVSDPLTGEFIFDGVVSIIAPVNFGSDMSDQPRSFLAWPIAYTISPYIRLYGLSLKMLMGIKQYCCEIITEFDPSQ